MTTTGSGKSILIVEDNSVDREWLALVLRRVGHDVVLAGHGEQALSFLEAGPSPDLILLDMLLPVLDGWHFLEHLQRAARAPRPPILIITATVLCPEWAAAHGCAGCLRKPLEEAALLHEVERCLS